MSANTHSIESIDGTKTYDADLDQSQRTLRVDGERIDLGICTDYEEWFGGDVEELAYSTGPYTVTIKIDRRKQDGTLYRITVEE